MLVETLMHLMEYELVHNISYKIACAPIEDSAALIRVFAVHLKTCRNLGYPQVALRLIRLGEHDILLEMLCPTHISCLQYRGLYLTQRKITLTWKYLHTLSLGATSMGKHLFFLGTFLSLKSSFIFGRFQILGR